MLLTTNNHKDSIWEIEESVQDTSKYSAPLDNDDQFLEMDVDESAIKMSINIQEKDAKCQILHTLSPQNQISPAISKFNNSPHPKTDHKNDPVKF